MAADGADYRSWAFKKDRRIRTKTQLIHGLWLGRRFGVKLQLVGDVTMSTRYFVIFGVTVAAALAWAPLTIPANAHGGGFKMHSGRHG